MAPRGDDFQLWFSPCSLAMCGGRALEQNTNQPKCKMALLMNLVLSNGLLTFNSYPRFSPVEKHHLITPTPLENVEPPNHPPKHALWPSINLDAQRGVDKHKRKTGKAARCHSTPFNFTRGPTLHDHA